MPTPMCYTVVYETLVKLSRCWDSDASVRQGRKNIPSMNFLFNVALLRSSMRDYLRHRDQFPIDTSQRRVVEMWTYYLRMCRSLNWYAFMPVIVTAPPDMLAAVRRAPPPPEPPLVSLGRRGRTRSRTRSRKRRRVRSKHNEQQICSQ